MAAAMNGVARLKLLGGYARRGGQGTSAGEVRLLPTCRQGRGGGLVANARDRAGQIVLGFRIGMLLNMVTQQLLHTHDSLSSAASISEIDSTTQAEPLGRGQAIALLR